MRSAQAVLVLGTTLGAFASQHLARAEQPSPTSQPPTASPQGKRQIDPKADALLRRMSDELSAMKSFQVDTSQTMEVVTHDGEKIHGLSDSTVTVQRPNKLRTDRMGPRGGGSLYYDGRNLTFYGKRDNLYATANAPETLDAAIDFARDQLSIDAPGADLLSSNPYDVLMSDVVSGRYMGEEPVGGRMCHHLAYRGNETDWQIWIEDGPRALPCRYVITSKREPGAPEYTVSTYNWKVNPRLSDDTFTFRPPPGAGKIAFVTVSDEIARQRKQTRR